MKAASQPSQPTQSPPCGQSLYHPLSLTALLRFSMGPGNADSDIHTEIQSYRASPASQDEDPLAWWRTHEILFPKLAKLAKKFLAIPASSAPSERAFSKVGIVVETKSKFASRKGKPTCVSQAQLARVINMWRARAFSSYSRALSQGRPRARASFSKARGSPTPFTWLPACTSLCLASAPTCCLRLQELQNRASHCVQNTRTLPSRGRLEVHFIHPSLFDGRRST